MKKRSTLRQKRALGVGGITVVAAAVGATALWNVILSRRSTTLPRNFVYQASGYGGYRTVAPTARKAATKTPLSGKPSPAATPDALAPALAAYGKGRFALAESAAKAALVQAQASQDKHPDVAHRRVAVKSLHLLAFTAAREHNLTLARDRFAQERIEAATLPDHGKTTVANPTLGADPTPTFEENAAYQHAVCTAALGDKAGAEREYLTFMRRYPDSPLLQAAVKRVSWLHSGNIPKEAEAVWESSMRLATAHQKTEERNESLCGPACLAELLRRAGKTAKADSTASLADEMRTNERGTSLLGLQLTARRHGFPGAQGVALTMRGLEAQTLPVIARIVPGHYVLVEAINCNTGEVQVWDPDAQGLNRGGTVALPARRWSAAWQGGVALTLRPPTKTPPVQVAATHITGSK